MKIQVISENENLLLKRKEIRFQIEPDKPGSTPSRFEVKNIIAAKLKAKPDMVFVKTLETKTGTQTTIGMANIYESIENAHALEPQHILKRNSPPEEESKEGN